MKVHNQFTNAFVLAFLLFAASGSIAAEEQKVTINKISASGVGEAAGIVVLKQTGDGLELNADLKGLPPGEHGFHVHEKHSCEPGLKDGKPAAGIGAGDHFVGSGQAKHTGPMGQGHQGDLPKLIIGADGTFKGTLRAPRAQLSDLHGRALMIHEHGDNYSDTPEPLGGGGGRIACGLID